MLHDGQVLADDVVHQTMQDVTRQAPDLVGTAHKGGCFVLFQLPPVGEEIRPRATAARGTYRWGGAQKK